MKLNIGCSWPDAKYKAAEWINFDLKENERVNVKGDALQLPFKTGSIDEIHCIHLLEHLTRNKYPIVIREMHRVLKEGGSCYVETPDFKGTVENLYNSFKNQDTEAIHIWTTSAYGKSERDGMAHHWGFYEGLLRREMRRQGFISVVRLSEPKEMISSHYRQEPILLVKGTK